MMKTLTTLTAAATVAAALTVAPTDAFAQRRGAAIGLGILGGIAAGAMSAVQSRILRPAWFSRAMRRIRLCGGLLAAPAATGRVPVYEDGLATPGWRGCPRNFCP